MPGTQVTAENLPVNIYCTFTGVLSCQTVFPTQRFHRGGRRHNLKGRADTVPEQCPVEHRLVNLIAHRLIQMQRGIGRKTGHRPDLTIIRVKHNNRAFVQHPAADRFNNLLHPSVQRQDHSGITAPIDCHFRFDTCNRLLEGIQHTGHLNLLPAPGQQTVAFLFNSCDPAAGIVQIADQVNRCLIFGIPFRDGKTIDHVRLNGFGCLGHKRFAGFQQFGNRCPPFGFHRVQYLLLILRGGEDSRPPALLCRHQRLHPAIVD